MFLFLSRGKQKNRLNHMQFIVLCLGRRDCISVSRLTFSRESSQKIEFCLAVLKIRRHKNTIPFQRLYPQISGVSDRKRKKEKAYGRDCYYY